MSTSLKADLHFHSSQSDGKHSVSELSTFLTTARHLNNLGLAVLTDHDGVAAYSEFARTVGAWCKPVCASELSCTYKSDIELHLLIYGLDPSDAELQAEFRRFREEREKRFFRICERLIAAGFKVDAAKIAEQHSGVLGRPHVADALVEAGYAANRVDAFERFLKDSRPYSVKKWRFPLESAVEYAKRHGCKTSIAHPGQYHFREGILKEFAELGVDALEVYHPRHSPSDKEFYRALAVKYGFKISGGSDFHAADTDQLIDGSPSLGLGAYTLELAENFLGDILND